MDTEQLSNDQYIREWFRTRELKAGTRERYLEGMSQYTEMTKKTPIQLIEEAESEIKQGILPRVRKIKLYILDFKDLLAARYAPTSRETYLSAIRSFYRAFDIDPPLNLSKANGAMPLERNINHNFGKEQVRAMAEYANTRDKAIILTMKSSGMARLEIINLTYRQFREGYDSRSKIATIRMRRQKTNTDFITFIDPEGTLAVINYLTKYRRYRGGFDSAFDDEPLFMSLKGDGKIDEKSFGLIFWLMAKKMRIHIPAKTKETRKFNALHSHNLRKFFNTALKNSGMNSDIVEFMLGHVGDRTKRAYYLQDAEKLKEQYIKHMHVLSIYSNGASIDIMEENLRLKNELDKAKVKGETPEEAFLAILEDEKLLNRLREKLKAV